jgi:quercetin dioxygenase-like cupin family protein
VPGRWRAAEGARVAWWRSPDLASELEPGEPRPGWHDCCFRSEFIAYYTVDAGSSIHKHAHAEEEVWHVVEGSLEAMVDGESRTLGPGHAAVVASNAIHSVRAISDARVIITPSSWGTESGPTPSGKTGAETYDWCVHGPRTSRTGCR